MPDEDDNASIRSNFEFPFSKEEFELMFVC